MKRLTEYTIPETGFTVVPEEKYKRILMDEKPSVEKVYNRLKKIEDILGDEYDLDLVQKLIQAYREGRYIILKEPEQAGISRLRELAEADREGRCVVLPAKVDETVYQVKKGDDCPCCFRLEGVNISEDGDITYPIYWGESFTPDDFGKKLFKTHNEAMAALRREQE